MLTYNKGYFDSDIKSNPLLHLWSLGVEEQFYIIWPCVISLTVNLFKKSGFKVLLGFTILSFLLGLVCVYYDAKFAFYFPLCRFWEMAIGGIIAYKNLEISNTVGRNLLSALGIIAILTTVWIIDEESLFPGYWALVPTLSAGCIIIAGN